jgi:hypothetical protein
MVSALLRKTSNTKTEESKAIHMRLAKILDRTNPQIEKVSFFPCALREFVNSNADLPTIEELVRRSQTLAQVMGMAS